MVSKSHVRIASGHASPADVEVAIVGAGPMGLAIAAELQSRGISLLHFEKGCIARTIDWFPHGMRFYSSARCLELGGFPLTTDGEKPTREDYLAYLRAFVRHHRLVVRTYEAVVGIAGCKDAFRLTTQLRDGRVGLYAAKRIVLAIGTTESPRRLGVPGEDLPHVSHYFDDPHRYFGHRVVIVGARNSACDAAILLHRVGADVILVHRGPEIESRHLKYWVFPEITGLIRRNAIAAHFDAQLTEIDANGVICRSKSGALQRIDCDFVLPLIGYEPDYSLIDALEIPTHNEQREPMIDHATFETSVRGVYCCGTIVAGNQNPYRVFVENAHHHPPSIADAICAELLPQCQESSATQAS